MERNRTHGEQGGDWRTNISMRDVTCTDSSTMEREEGGEENTTLSITLGKIFFTFQCIKDDMKCGLRYGQQ